MSTATSNLANWKTSPLHALATRLRVYLAGHPEITWEQFMRDAVTHEIANRGQRRESPSARSMRPRPAGMATLVAASDNEMPSIRWLDERLNAYYQSEHGWWTRVRHLLFGKSHA